MASLSSAAAADLIWNQSRGGWLRVEWPSGRIRGANPKAVQLVGYNASELAGRPFWELFEAESAERLRDWIADWQRGGEPGERAGVWLHRIDGVAAPITVRAFRVSDDSDDAFLVLEDRRDLQSVVARLAETEARLEESERVARLWWWEWDIARDVASWSESLYSIFGLAPSEFDGSLKTFLHGVHPDDRAAVRKSLRATLKRNEPYAQQFRTLRSDGTVRYIQARGRAQRDEEGRPLRLYGTCQDVTERALALIELAKSEQKYRDLVETSNELIWAVDVEGRITFVNRAVREMYGYEPDEVLNRQFTMLLPPELVEADWQVFQRVLAGGELFNYETVHLRKNGERLNLSFNAIATRDASGNVIGTSGTAINITERKRHEQLLQERESWFRAIFENAPQCLVILTLDGHLLDINPTGRQLLEVDPGESLIGDDCGKFLTSDSRRVFYKALAESQDGSTHSWEAQIIGAKGTKRWLEGQFVPLRDANGQVIRLLAAVMDVTARRKADAFREGEQQVLEEIASGQNLHRALRTLIKMLEQQLPGALCTVMMLKEEQSRLLVAASSAMPDDVTRRIAAIRVTPGAPSFADSVATGQRRIVEDTTVESSWRELRTLSDRFQLRSCWSQPIRGFSNDVLGTLTIFFMWPRSPNAEELQLLDTGAYLAGIAIYRTRSEQALRDSEKRFRTLFEHSPDAIFVESLTGIVLDVNPAACTLHGMSREELVGKHVMELVPLECRDDVRRDFPRLANGELTQLEGYSLHRELGAVPISLHVSKTEYALQPALLLHVRDITQRKQAEQKAREAEAQLAHVGRLTLMGELMAGISHEINQPLFAIANFANASEKLLLDGKLDQIDKLLEWNKKIAAQANRAGEIIRRMRDFSRKSTPHRSTVELHDMIHEAVELVASDTRSHQVQLQLDVRPEPLLVLADRIQIQQTIVNLLRNAYRAMAENSIEDRHVTLKTELQDRILKISVRDNGHGFRGVDPEQIFNPFFTTKPDGLGLGLTISRSIVEAHGGKLWAEQNPDAGATFIFTLPLGYDGDTPPPKHEMKT